MSDPHDEREALLAERAALRARVGELEAEVGHREDGLLARLVVDSLPDFVYLTDPAGVLVYCSPSVRHVLGHEPARLIGTPAADTVHPDDLPALRAQEPRLLAGETVPVFYRHRHADGSWRWLEAWPALASWNGSPHHVLRAARDVTGRRREEQERRRAEVRLRQAQKFESLGVLAGGVAHDFNNLLTGVLGNASLALLDLPPGSPTRHNLQQIETAALRAAELTRQMLAYAGKGRFTFRPTDLSRAVEEAAPLLRAAVSRRADLRFELADGLPPARADADQVSQVVAGLVANASEALGDGEGVVTVRTGAARVDRTTLASTFVEEEDAPEGDYCFVEVADTGCGMARATLARVFDPFFTTKFQGRGLGLAAALGIVRGHKGALKVHSTPGRGSTFRALFPCAVPEAEEGLGWRGRGLVLVVEEDEVARWAAERALRLAGFRVLPTGDGPEGLEVFRRHADEVVAVLLDQPGREAFGEARRPRPDVPVVLMSGYGENEAADLFAGLGFDGFLRKPFRAEELVEVLRRVLTPPRP